MKLILALTLALPAAHALYRPLDRDQRAFCAEAIQVVARAAREAERVEATWRRQKSRVHAQALAEANARLRQVTRGAEQSCGAED